jgi:ferredoxin
VYCAVYKALPDEMKIDGTIISLTAREKMAYKITEECISCGACEDECPNQAIREGENIYVIDAARCTECVGAHEISKCKEICPVDACVPDANNHLGCHRISIDRKPLETDYLYAFTEYEEEITRKPSDNVSKHEEQTMRKPSDTRKFEEF